MRFEETKETEEELLETKKEEELELRYSASVPPRQNQLSLSTVALAQQTNC